MVLPIEQVVVRKYRSLIRIAGQLLLTKDVAEGNVKSVMTKMIGHIAIVAISLLLLVSPLYAVTRKPKSGDDNKAKPVDTAKLAPAKKDSVAKAALPVLPTAKDTSDVRKPVPAKLNDFQDKNKNGIDDRVEKAPTDSKKPAVTIPTPTATKKSSGDKKTTVAPKKSK